MNNTYIYKSSYKSIEDNIIKEYSCTVIFFYNIKLIPGSISGDIQKYYEEHFQTDKILILAPAFIEDSALEIFIHDTQLFKSIPKLNEDFLANNLSIYKYSLNGVFFEHYKEDIFLTLNLNKKCTVTNQEIYSGEENIIHDGLQYIFINRGGLVEAAGDAHHFIFPSGKHSNKFIRTSNVLIYSSEIYFIAASLLNSFNEEEHKFIYSDTSSINSLAFALIDLVKQFLVDPYFSIPINSFSSYEGLEKSDIKFNDNSFLLISASTSGNIITRIQKRHPINSKNIKIVYFLGPKDEFQKSNDSIICNITKSENNKNGITLYDSYSDLDCQLCSSGSFPVPVKGDVFLLEKPKINQIVLGVKDAPPSLTNFVKTFKSKNVRDNNCLKVNYKEHTSAFKNYDVYIDIHKVIDHLITNPDDSQFIEFKIKLIDYINQYIPSSVQYLITLPDEGSKLLATFIKSYLVENYSNRDIKIVDFNNFNSAFNEEAKNISGSVVVVASCIANGKNLLFLSRSLRPFEKLRIKYFVALNRMSCEEESLSLQRNLKQGTYGAESFSFIAVETMYCNNLLKKTTWINEIEFLKEVNEHIDENSGLEIYSQIIADRISLLENSQGNQMKGMANEIFYKNFDKEDLEIRKGFVFLKFPKFEENVSQSDIYFTISTVLNNTRNSSDNEHTLKQSEHVRNLLCPSNFSRFNDGIIQASLLRSAFSRELSYHIDPRLSRLMRETLEKIIVDGNYKTQQGEALAEFVFALASKKLTLVYEDVKYITEELLKINDFPIVEILSKYLSKVILEKKGNMLEEIKRLREENKSLKIR